MKMVKIGDFCFEEKWEDRGTCLMYFEADEEYEESAQWSIDISCRKGKYKGEDVSPSICINPIDTDKKSVEELVGIKHVVENIEECVVREDTFYVFEHEPMCDYEISVEELNGDKAHIVGQGKLVVDGYADPYTVDDFEIDCWVPIILSVDDWEKFE